jgi:phosphotriesterase-related protein
MRTSNEERELLRQRVSRRKLLKTGATTAVGAAAISLGACAGENKKDEGALATAATPTRAAVAGPFVETMIGPVSTADLGFTLMHEHIFSRSEGVEYNFPFVWDQQAEIDHAIETLTRLKAEGVNTILDPTVLGLGRDIRLLLPIVEKAGIQVIVATGIYTYNELPFYFQNRDVDHMADVFIHDIESGIEGMDVKAAVLKCCTDAPGVTPGVEKVLRAVARAHLRTGVPITTHTHAATRRGLEQQDIFASEGVDLRRVIIGHSGDSEDLNYLTNLADRGSYIGMDRFGLEAILSTEKRVAVVTNLCQMGYADRMVLSHDAMAYFDWYEPEVIEAFGPNWNYFHIIGNVIPALLEAGVSQQQIDTMTRDNPRRIFENVGI